MSMTETGNQPGDFARAWQHVLGEPTIWWLDQSATEAVYARMRRGELKLPAYLRRQVNSRYGRAGRGRLWIDEQAPHCSVDPWPDTELARLLEYDHGGIVLKPGDAAGIVELPGIVTDLRLNRLA